MTDNERSEIIQKIGYLTAKVEDINETVHEIKNKLEQKVDKDENFKSLAVENEKNSDFRKNLTSKVSVIAASVAGGISLIGFIVMSAISIFF
jgi:regulator of replication initiation timing